MKCLNPILVKWRDKNPMLVEENNGYTEKETLVPCRKCNECQRKYSLEWVRRILHEYEINGYIGCFVTLTYDPELEPIHGVSKDAMQLFFKRLRKNLNGRPIKYYCCGEYGEMNGHAHYHAIIINISPREKPIIEKSWGQGIVDSKSINYASAKYVVDYMNKNIPEDIINGRNPCFTLKSKGVGLKWFIKYMNEIIDDKCITDKGHKVSIPRYYLRKLKDNTIENGNLYYTILTEKDEQLNENWNYYVNQYKDVIQHNENIKAKNRLK